MSIQTPWSRIIQNQFQLFKLARKFDSIDILINHTRTKIKRNQRQLMQATQRKFNKIEITWIWRNPKILSVKQPTSDYTQRTDYTQANSVKWQQGGATRNFVLLFVTLHYPQSLNCKQILSIRSSLKITTFLLITQPPNFIAVLHQTTFIVSSLLHHIHGLVH